MEITSGFSQSGTETSCADAIIMVEASRIEDKMFFFMGWYIKTKTR